jgi:hypothetical protein
VVQPGRVFAESRIHMKGVQPEGQEQFSAINQTIFLHSPLNLSFPLKYRDAIAALFHIVAATDSPDFIASGFPRAGW